MLIFFTILLPDIYIEDFYRTLISFDFFSPEDGVKYADVLEYLLSYRPETRFDVIFSVGPLQLSGPGCVFLQVSASSNFTSPESLIFRNFCTREVFSCTDVSSPSVSIFLHGFSGLLDLR